MSKNLKWYSVIPTTSFYDMNQKMLTKKKFSDSNNIILWHESEDVNKKKFSDSNNIILWHESEDVNKKKFSDSNNIILWHESEDVNKKKIQWFQQHHSMTWIRRC